MRPLEAADPRQVGPYTLLGRLGSGGMGSVYLGRSAGGRAVAVKLIRPELADDRRFRDRFRHEVAAARTASSAFTAPVVDADPDAPLPWLATSYVPGVPLDEAVRLVGPFPEPALRILAAGVAEELAAIHAAGLTHRDLKPSNVLLALDGPHVIDFGIARAADDSALTAQGTVLGTPAYLSPEQALARPAGPAADVFSLGSTLVHAATGAGPFGPGHPLEVVRRVAAEEPDLGGVPAGLRLLIAACLAKDPADRPTPRQLIAALGLAPHGPGTWLHPELVAAIERSAAVLAPALPPAAVPAPADRPPLLPPPPPPLPPTVPLPAGPPRPARRTLLYGLAGGALALAGGGTALYLTLGDDRPTGKDGGGKAPGAAPTHDLTDPERQLDTAALATPLWTTPLADPITQLLGDGSTLLTVSAKNMQGFDLDGKARWAPRTAPGTFPVLTLGPALAADGKGYYLGWYQNGTAKYDIKTALQAVDLATGETAWAIPRSGTDMLSGAGSVCGLLDGTLYVQGVVPAPNGGGQDQLLWAVDPATRKTRWEQRIRSGALSSSRLAVPSTGTRLLLRLTDMSAGKVTLQGIDTANDGSTAWTQPAPGNALSTSALTQSATDGPHTSAGGRLIHLSDRVYALDPADGSVAWKSAAPLSYQSAVTGTDGRTVYAVAADYATVSLRVQALDAGTGAVRWAGKLPAGVLLTNLAALFADDTLYVWAQGKVWALDPATGNARWSYQFTASPTSLDIPLWAGGGRVYGPTEQGLTAVAATGKAP
ncbi:serine/threonine-protein kinase [Kitasatospora cineracea]|uniref:Serine/threonine protein kinase n=1 Tax=Kitasatospora cineracea TaxID=88074 RepID=A0A8G1UF08_9ACTN|nr:PQQ-binding-like beta-propeller repeat protein [Kitasatospora cineracea]ROR37349.1 serine/threonine protein kinase [Kitasatospora cineracea]